MGGNRLTWEEISRELDKARREGKSEWRRLADLIQEAKREGKEVELPNPFVPPKGWKLRKRGYREGT